jgi:hypothetical protein
MGFDEKSHMEFAMAIWEILWHVTPRTNTDAKFIERNPCLWFLQAAFGSVQKWGVPTSTFPFKW